MHPAVAPTGVLRGQARPASRSPRPVVA
jgi:hypothetical protein